MDWTNILVAVIGASGGAGFVGWIAKLLIGRFLRENDNKHLLAMEAIQKVADRQYKSHRALSDKLSDLKTDTEVVKTRIGEVLNIRSDVIDQGKEVAIMAKQIENLSHDFDEETTGTKHRFDIMDREITAIKQLVAANN